MSIHLDEQEAKSTAQDHGDQLLPDQLAEGFFISVTEMILGSAGTVVRGWTYGATKDFCGKDACKNCEGC